MKLDKYDIALANVSSANADYRPVLNTLRLHNGNLEAADGYMLIRRQADLETGDDSKSVLFPAKMIKAIRSSPKRIAKLNVDSTKATVTYADDKDKTAPFNPTVTFDLAQGDYPDTDRLFPGTEKKAQVAINIGLLKRLLSCMPDKELLRIGVVGPQSPVEIEVTGMDRPIRGVIMPAFLDWSNFVWHRDKPKPAAIPTPTVAH